MTNDLTALSEAATPGEWRVRVGPRDDQDTCDLAICGDIFVLADFNGPQYPHQHPNAAFIVALVNAYRAKQVVLIGPDAVEALKYADGVLEADMFDAMDHGDADWEGQARHSLEAIRAALAALGVK